MYVCYVLFNKYSVCRLHIVHAVSGVYGIHALLLISAVRLLTLTLT